MPRLRIVLFAFSVLLVAAAAGLFALTTFAPKLADPGVAQIGGPFSLTDHAGQRVTEQDFRGKPMLVVFGYTFCPDVCPGEMQVISAALDSLGPDAARLQPLFVSVDPRRDTPKVVADFISNFHPGFRGLTGSEAEVATMTRAYRVLARIVPNETRPQDYLVEHTSLIYLMDAEGKYLTHFRYGTDARALADALKAALRL